MNEKIVEILEKPLQVRLGILAGSVALIGAGYWYLFYGTLSEKVTVLNTEIESVKAQIAEKKGIAANLEKYEKEVERLDIELKRALLELPDRREIDQLLDRISDKAKDSGLEISLFKPSGETPQDFYAEIPVQLEVSGNYHQLATFFDEVARLGRVVNVQIQSMGKPLITDRKVSLEASLVATSFRFLDESERSNSSGGAPEGKKKRRKKEE